jgi:glycosyltransferase involved in cell wall biosynthesis
LGLPEKRYLIVTACRLEAKKGIDFLLNSFARLRAEVPEAHLVIVGDGKQGPYYQWLAESLGLNDRVTFAGRISHTKVHTYYWAADLFVLASREYINQARGVRDVETMGRVLCEANAAGVPVVAARSGGIPSVIAHEENGLLFQPEDTSDLIAQVKRLLTEPVLEPRLVEAGRRISWERFDWSVVLKAHEQTFEKFYRNNRKKSKTKDVRPPSEAQRVAIKPIANQGVLEG